MNLNDFAISHEKDLSKIAREFGIIFLVAFGSAVTGKTHAESDLDLACFTKIKINGQKFLALFGRLQDIFRGFNVHLNILNEADILFRHKIVCEGKLLFGNKDHFQAYKLLTHKIYLTDMPKISKFYDRILINKQRELQGYIYGR